MMGVMAPPLAPPLAPPSAGGMTPAPGTTRQAPPPLPPRRKSEAEMPAVPAAQGSDRGVVAASTPTLPHASSGVAREDEGGAGPVPGPNLAGSGGYPAVQAPIAGPNLAGSGGYPSVQAIQDASRTPAPATNADTLSEEVKARAARLRLSDAIGAGRAHLEAGLVAEWVRFDRDDARVEYTTARGLLRGAPSAATRVRRLLDPKTERVLLLEILREEHAHGETDALRADLLATIARVLEAQGELEKARESFEEALALVPNHPGALRGLETLLRREALTSDDRERWTQLATHLDRLASLVAPAVAQDADVVLSAWLHVERADILERLGAVPDAHAALESAVALVPAPGPVRAALTTHLAKHDRDVGLVEALRHEAGEEADDDRASRLLYAAARLCLGKRESRPEATQLLQQAAQRAPAGTPTQRRILAELASQLEAAGSWAAAAEVRQRRLPLLSRKDAQVHEYARLCEAFEQLGRADLTADAAARALAIDPTDAAMHELLDRALDALGQNEARVRHWIARANADRPLASRVAAYVRAAAISVHRLQNRPLAIEYLRAAWSLDAGNASVFDELSALLAPPRIDPTSDPRGVLARLDLYAQAAQVENERERKIALLEKLAAIHEDELGEPRRALEIADRILALEPRRRSAILLATRNAARAGDDERLVRALWEESEITEDPVLRCRILLRASEIWARRGDTDRALGLVERALALQPGDHAALRARQRHHERVGRLDEARKALLDLVEHAPEEAFETWLEIARLDEVRRKNQKDAVAAYRAAARLRPEHPLPRAAIVRLYRALGDWERLVVALKSVVDDEADPFERGMLEVQIAEVQEICIGDADAALASLAAADEDFLRAAAGREGPVGHDPAVLEAMERVLAAKVLRVPKKGARPVDAAPLVALYAKWLERTPPVAVDHSVRIALARVLARTAPDQAVSVLEGLLFAVPGHVAALRTLEHLHRAKGTLPALTQVLTTQADVTRSRVARCGALWEVASLEDRVGLGVGLEALARIVAEQPHDHAALDGIIRIASKLTVGVAVPHPAALAARGRLFAALRQRRELTIDPTARAALLLEEAMLAESGEDADPRLALEAYREAQSLWPDGLLAARGLDRVGTRLGDAEGVLAANLSLVKLSEDPKVKAAHLVRAAEITHAHRRDERQALELYEVALATDPESRQAVQALASMLASDGRRLVDRFGEALERAQSTEQIVLLGSSIGSSVLHLGESGQSVDQGIGVRAVRRVLERVPDDPNALLLVARLFHAQQMWAEARDAYIRIVDASRDPALRVSAYFAAADLYEGPLADLGLAESTFVAILGIDPRNKVALERLVAIALRRGDADLVCSTLRRLAEYESDPHARLGYDLRLAEAYRESGDAAGGVQALADAIVSAPQDPRALAALLRIHRPETPEGAKALASLFERLPEAALARRMPIDPRWFFLGGMLEVHALGRAADGVAHLQKAVALGNLAEMRVGYGQALLAAGRAKEAANLLRDLFVESADMPARLCEPAQLSAIRQATVAPQGTVLGATLVALDAALAADGRPEERLVVDEIRACLGELPPERASALRARRLPAEAPVPGSLTGVDLARILLPEARTPLISVAVAMAPIAAKVLRFEIGSLGLSSRERIGTRDLHAVRILAERAARAFGIELFELYLSPSWQGPARVFPGDPPAIVAHTSFGDLPEPELFFALGRIFCRMALGLTWLDELPPEQVDGLLVASLRAVVPQFGSGELSNAREIAVQTFATPVQKAIGRRQRKMIEEVMPTLSAAYDPSSFVHAARRSEWRAAYLLAGDLVASVDYLRRTEAELTRLADGPRTLLRHPVVSELIRFALSPEALAERKRIGTGWA
jgi:tetratricopeptide (TPR) repeat protein